MGHKYVKDTWIQAAEQAWYVCTHQTCLIRLAKRTKPRPSNMRTKRNVLSCLIECLMAFKFYQTRSNSSKQGGQTVIWLITKQCLMLFKRQTFPVWPGPKTSGCGRIKPSFHMSEKSQTIGDFAVSQPSQILPTNENHKS